MMVSIPFTWDLPEVLSKIRNGSFFGTTMPDLIDGYKKPGLVSDKPWYTNFVCGDCSRYTGEECDGWRHEGSERYDDSPACEEFDSEGWLTE